MIYMDGERTRCSQLWMCIGICYTKKETVAVPIVGLITQSACVLIRARFDIRWTIFYTFGIVTKAFFGAQSS